MDQARTKALELAIVFMASRAVENAQQLLDVADIFCAYIEPSEPTAVDGDDYPRIQLHGKRLVP